MRKHISILLILAILSSCALITSCTGRRNDPEIVVELFCDQNIMDRYMKNITGYDHVIYEQVYADFGGRSIGPTEYRYRGIVYLTPEEASRLERAYNWEESDDPEVEFGKIDDDFIGDGPWHTSRQFEQDTFKTVSVISCAFDGSKIVFDIIQS